MNTNDGPATAPADFSADPGGAVSSGGTPPTAPGLPLLGIAHRLALDKYGFAQRISQQHGDIVRLPMPRRKPVFLISNPEMINQVFVRLADKHRKGAMFTAVMAPLPDPPISVQEGTDWRRMRRLANGHFGVAGLRPLLATMDTVIEEHVADFSSDVGDRPADVEGLLAVMAIDVLLQTIFNRQLPRRRLRRMTRQLRGVSEGGAIRWAWFWLPAPLRYLASAAKDIRGLPMFWEMYRLVRDGTAADEGGDDFLTRMREATFEDGSKLTDSQLRSEMFEFVFAGFETTTAAMSWALAMLATNPDAMRKAAEEVDRLGRTPTHEDIASLPYVRACWDEAQRIQGLPYYSRDSFESQVLGGYHIPAGSMILCSPYAVQNDPRIWDDPSAFKPERWEDGSAAKHAYLQFGIGERRCLGVNVANFEGVLFLAKALSKYTFEAPPGWQPERVFRMVTGIRGGLPITITARRRQVAGATQAEHTK